MQSKPLEVEIDKLAAQTVIALSAQTCVVPLLPAPMLSGNAVLARPLHPHFPKVRSSIAATSRIAIAVYPLVQWHS